MLTRTHVAVGLAVAFYFMPYVTHKIVFFPIILIASLLPDIDSAASAIGKHAVFRPLQWIFSHRGVIHSYTVCIVVSVLFAFFIPVLAFPFFLGYSFHLFMDSFTVQGIMVFWPLKQKSTGPVRTGGSVESAIFVVMVIVDFALLVKLFV